MSAAKSDALRWLALAGIPVAAFGILLFCVEIPRLLYGGSRAPFLALECASLLGWAALALYLRSTLPDPAEPGGFFRDVLDFFAMKRWHPAVVFGLIGLIVLPFAWLSASNYWLYGTLSRLGRRAFAMSDVRNALDAYAAVFQHALTSGTPLLFVYHLVCRRWLSGRFLPWLLLPLLFLGTAIGAIITVTIMRFAR